MPATSLTLLSSMATQALLRELVSAYAHQQPEVRVHLESVGGVVAEQRVAAGEALDVVVLGSDALGRLMAGGHLRPDSRVDIALSGVAVAVPAGQPRPDIRTEAALRAAVLAAPRISCSTGPSGVALTRLFERWGIGAQVQAKCITPPPGTPVGALLARGEAALGFQQLSELMHLSGIDVLGPLPAPIQITTTFSGAVAACSAQPQAAQGLLHFLADPANAALKQRHGMHAAT